MEKIASNSSSMKEGVKSAMCTVLHSPSPEPPKGSLQKLYSDCRISKSRSWEKGDVLPFRLNISGSANSRKLFPLSKIAPGTPFSPLIVQVYLWPVVDGSIFRDAGVPCGEYVISCPETISFKQAGMIKRSPKCQ